jgi:hypothetical protein
MRWLVPCVAFLAVSGALADPRIDQARKEGEVVWYTATGEKVRTRILTEARAKRFAWDVALRHRMSLGKNFEAFAARRSSRGARAAFLAGD